MAREPIKLLYVITDLDVGGVPLHLLRLATAMRDRGYVPSVVSLARPGPVTERLRRIGIPVTSCGGRGGWDLRVLGRLTQVIKERRPDVVHALLFHANLAARFCIRRAAVPPERLICEIQTVELERKWHLAADRWTHLRCRLTIGNSPSVIDHLATHARIPRERLHLVRGGIDAGPYRAAAPTARSSLGLKGLGALVLWTGRLDPVKGLFLLLEAFQSVHQQSGAHLLLAGGGALADRLRRLISHRGLAGHVHLLGVRDDIMSLLKTADVFVLPSRVEGLPNSLLEAMAAGCPIVATDVPGCRDLIEHERTGLLVPFGDAEGLAAAILRLLRNRLEAQGLARAASAEVRKNWSIKATLDAYESIYREIVPPL